MKMDEITKMTPDTGKRETIKTPFAKIIVGGTAEKPYYMICYYDTTEKQFVVCFGSYNRDFVFQWLAEDFEIIDNGAFDAVPVVRCRECKHAEPYKRNDGATGYYCHCRYNVFEYGDRGKYTPVRESDDYCSYGEREEQNDN